MNYCFEQVNKKIMIFSAVGRNRIKGDFQNDWLLPIPDLSLSRKWKPHNPLPSLPPNPKNGFRGRSRIINPIFNSNEKQW
jgi:hypothetical protein